MFDDLDRLRNNARLLELLSHYANLGEPKRDTWHGRLTQLEGLEPPAMTKLHGELIAFGWVEQNTGNIPTCYRITSSGLRALRNVEVRDDDEEGLKKAA